MTSMAITSIIHDGIQIAGTMPPESLRKDKGWLLIDNYISKVEELAYNYGIRGEPRMSPKGRKV